MLRMLFLVAVTAVQSRSCAVARAPDRVSRCPGGRQRDTFPSGHGTKPCSYSPPAPNTDCSAHSAVQTPWSERCCVRSCPPSAAVDHLSEPSTLMSCSTSLPPRPALPISCSGDRGMSWWSCGVLTFAGDRSQTFPLPLPQIKRTNWCSSALAVGAGLATR